MKKECYVLELYNGFSYDDQDYCVIGIFTSMVKAKQAKKQLIEEANKAIETIKANAKRIGYSDNYNVSEFTMHGLTCCPRNYGLTITGYKLDEIY